MQLRRRSSNAPLLAEIRLGDGQVFVALVDTGSGSLAVASADCSSRGCEGHRRFRPQDDESGRFLSKEASDVHISYAGVQLSGSGFESRVCLGDACGRAGFVVAAWESDAFRGLDFDAILGLGPPRQAVARGFNILEAMVSQGSLPRAAFVLQLRSQGNSSLALGTVGAFDSGAASFSSSAASGSVTSGGHAISGGPSSTVAFEIGTASSASDSGSASDTDASLEDAVGGGAAGDSSPDSDTSVSIANSSGAFGSDASSEDGFSGGAAVGWPGSWLPADARHGEWAVHLQDVAIDLGMTGACAKVGGCRAILDSGCPNILLPAHAFDLVRQRLTPNDCSLAAIQALPGLRFFLGGESVAGQGAGKPAVAAYEIGPERYVEVSRTDPSRCRLLVEAAEGSTRTVVLGLPFLLDRDVAFDQDRMLVAVAGASSDAMGSAVAMPALAAPRSSDKAVESSVGA